MSMRQLQELTSLIIALDFVHPRKVSSVADTPRIIPSGKTVTIDTGLNAPGVVLYRQSYTAVFNIDEYPFKKHAPAELFGHICAYLLEYGNGTDEIPEPETDVDVLDNDTANIEVRIKFEQDVYAVEDAVNGTILYRGKRYRIAEPEIDYVLSGDVVT
ncbi:MAG: phage tail protein [Methylobacter sp.]